MNAEETRIEVRTAYWDRLVAAAEAIGMPVPLAMLARGRRARAAGRRLSSARQWLLAMLFAPGLNERLRIGTLGLDERLRLYEADILEDDEPPA